MRCALVTLLALSSLPVLVACPSDGSPRPIGATCESAGKCSSGLCLATTCVDPEADDDGDGLVNRIEGALDTNLPERQRRRISDRDEVGDVDAPSDEVPR